MTDTAQADWTVRAGNSGTVENEGGLVFRLLESDAVTPRDLTGATFVCRMTDATGASVLRKDAATGLTVDLPKAEVVVPITVAESRLLHAAAKPVQYDLERRQGSDQRTEIGGTIFTMPGSNDD